EIPTLLRGALEDGVAALVPAYVLGDLLGPLLLLAAGAGRVAGDRESHPPAVPGHRGGEQERLLHPPDPVHGAEQARPHPVGLSVPLDRVVADLVAGDRLRPREVLRDVRDRAGAVVVVDLRDRRG